MDTAQVSVKFRMKRQQGVTLFEIIVVLAILATLTTTATFVWRRSYFTPFLQSAELAADLRYARTLAMNRRRVYQVKLNETSYQLTDANDDAVNFPGAGTSTINLHSGLFLSSAQLPNDSVFFNGYGEPMTDSSTKLANLAVISIAPNDGSQAHSLTISPQTGFINND